jgi:hypothetical protein
MILALATLRLFIGMLELSVELLAHLALLVARLLRWAVR